VIRRVLAAFALAFVPAVIPIQAHAQVAMGSPSWSQLTPPERQVLAPLASDWNNMDAQRKQKWRDIAQRYPNMGNDERQRIQEQMKSWAELTPQQRQAARERYKSLRKLPPEKKNEVRQRWQEYQSLPPEQKRELALHSAPTPGGAAKPANPRIAAPAPSVPPAGQAPAAASTEALRTR
jgi:hypothetical protein